MTSLTITLNAAEQGLLRAAAAELRSSRPEIARLLERLGSGASGASGEAAPPPATASITEIAAAFGVTTQTIRNWADRGWLPSSRTPGGTRRFPRSILEQSAGLNAPRPAGVREHTDAEIQELLGVSPMAAESSRP